MMKKSRQAGFTIIELTIATAVFSLILLVITAGIINFSKSYLKGVHQSQTQETTRTVMSELTQAIQFSSTKVETADPNGSWGAYCVGNIKYSYRIGEQVNDATDSHALKRSPHDGGTCTATTGFNASVDTELIGNNMQLSQFGISDNGSGSYTVSMRVVYGDAELLNGDQCASGASSQFCATASLSSTVQQRL